MDEKLGKVKAGDRICVNLKDSEEIGVLMPTLKEGVLIIKLDSGYNLGFEMGDVTGIKVLEKAKEPATQKGEVTENSKLKTISILHTGGTIASKVDYRTGGVTTEFTPEQLVGLFPELSTIANIRSELVAQMWSDELRFSHFSLLAEKIRDHVEKGVDGIIIGMGTDNLAVASAALSFIVEESPIPIILVGSQRSSDRGSSDAGMNLICAANFIVETDFGGVAICMHDSSNDEMCAILPGCKTYKLHSSRRDAFRAVNDTVIARVDSSNGGIAYEHKGYRKRGENLVLKPSLEEKVGLLKVHINMVPEQIAFYHGYKGLVVEGTGLGHLPTQVPNEECAIHAKIDLELKKLVASGCIVVMTTRCLFGGINMNVYDQGRDLLEIGVLSGRDMLSNTAFVKLSWLLANHGLDDVKQMMGENLRGEIRDLLHYEENIERGG